MGPEWAQLHDMSSRLRDTADALHRRWARNAGATWADISAQFGVSDDGPVAQATETLLTLLGGDPVPTRPGQLYARLDNALAETMRVHRLDGGPVDGVYPIKGSTAAFYGFDREGHAHRHDRAYPADTNLAAADAFSIKGPEPCGHPVTLWAFDRYGAKAVSRKATAMAVGGKIEIPVRYRPRLARVGDQSLPTLSADLTFSCAKQRYAIADSGTELAVAGEVVEMMRSFHIAVKPDSLTSQPSLIAHADLTFEVVLRAYLTVLPIADVSWKLSYAVSGETTNRHRSGRITVRPDGTVQPCPTSLQDFDL